jgi:hypothetical protein
MGVRGQQISNGNGNGDELKWSIDQSGRDQQYGENALSGVGAKVMRDPYQDDKVVATSNSKAPGGENPQRTPGKYNQDWYDQNVWNSPEVIGAKTRRQREAAINRIIRSQAGDGLRQNYITMHGNENDAEIAMTI